MEPRLAALLVLVAFSHVRAGGQSRSVMLWQLESSDDVVANLRAHRENITAVSPCVYQFDGSGNFVTQPKYWKSISPFLANYTAMGLDVIPLIAAGGGVGGMARLGQKFIDDAVAEALKMGYKGYNFDNELRGKYTESSWAPLVAHAAPWMAFLNAFADALHSHNLTLSADIEGCCGWVDTDHPKAPAGHCTGAFAKYEFVATQCAMYKESHLDQVYGMATYSTTPNAPPDYPYGTKTLLKIVTAAQGAVGPEKYSTGIKGAWPYCTNTSDPSTCVFDDMAKKNIRHLRDDLGVGNLAWWVDTVGHMPSQTQWDLWGFFLHDKPSPASATLVV